MRTKLLLMIAVALVLGLNVQAAINWDIYDDTTISGGDYDFVNVYNEAKVDISGETTSIYWLETHNKNIIGLENGTVSSFLLYDNSIFNMLGGTISDLNITDVSIAHLHEGTISNFAAIYDTESVIHAYGYNLEIDILSSDYYLTGQWESGEEINIWLRGPYTYQQTILHEIPEPSSLLLMAFSCFFLRKNKKT